ncbi:MAG: MBL fold metallo-hydrolase [Clostridia bacterium]|nr:MBL fold metallo-hydrolase [Clostridia bacterium]
MVHLKKTTAVLLAVLMILTLVACANDPEPQTPAQSEAPIEQIDLIEELSLNASVKDATVYTAEVNSAVYSMLDFENTQEWEFATRSLIDAPEVLELKDADGNVIWSQAAFSFLDEYEKAPDTVNPSLWENTRNNHAYGLFEVVEGIYQVRGYDMANLTVIAGDTGWIVFDPLMSVECTQAAMQLIEKNLGQRPVKAVIISHPHVDHFGGIKGVMAETDAADPTLSIEEQLQSGRIPIIVPEGFTEHAVSENVYAGRAMTRRANYQYGTLLEPGVTGSLAMGIGMGQSTGTVTFIAPTYEIKTSGEVITIDGVQFEFQMTPGTEAPAEMNTWLPQFKALWLAENCTGTLHNLYTLRGAQVRDGAAWAGYILEAIALYGDRAEVTFQSHNWPHWGNDVIREYLVNTAAIYQFINDQTLTYINQGYTSEEICNMIRLPEELAQSWYTRQYYGTLSHNARAVYQKYMGWYDANPVNLDPLTPTESAEKWVEYLGDTDAVLRKAKEDYDKGEYRWVAEITGVLVFADPENEAARLLCADAMEQLGYQAESGPWRNAYLTAALELRGIEHTASAPLSDGSVQKEMTADMIFDYMGILLDKQALLGKDFTMNVILPDVQEQHMLQIKSGVLLHYKGTLAEDADVTVTCPKNALLLIMRNNADGLAQASKVEGNTALLTEFIKSLDQLDLSTAPNFNIIEP